MRTSAEQTRKQFNIPVISSPRFQYANPHLTRGVNFNNLLADERRNLATKTVRQSISFHSLIL